MTLQKEINYYRIAKAIEFIQENFKRQPPLDEVAEAINVSPFHFQRMFSEWAGTTPKKFLQYVSMDHAKKLLKENASVFEAAYQTGLSGTSRLHDLFVNIEGMTPAEYRDGGRDLLINYSISETPFGEIVIGSTPKGICHMAFEEDLSAGVQHLQNKFPNAHFISTSDQIQAHALSIFGQPRATLPNIKLHLKGTPFQLKVWEALLQVPAGQLTTYGAIANQINLSSASRAVGTAIGCNPVAFLIPCHRVIRSSGALGGYMWGTTRKAAIIGWESLRSETLI